MIDFAPKMMTHTTNTNVAKPMVITPAITDAVVKPSCIKTPEIQEEKSVPMVLFEGEKMIEEKNISAASDILVPSHSCIQYSIALRKARKHRVVQGQILNNTEMNTIISDLMKCENSRFTPTGEPIYTLISNDQFFSLTNVA